MSTRSYTFSSSTSLGKRRAEKTGSLLPARLQDHNDAQESIEVGRQKMGFLEIAFQFKCSADCKFY